MRLFNATSPWIINLVMVIWWCDAASWPLCGGASWYNQDLQGPGYIQTNSTATQADTQNVTRLGDSTLHQPKNELELRKANTKMQRVLFSIQGDA